MSVVVPSEHMITITGGDGVDRVVSMVQVIALFHSVKMEKVGLKRRGRSATVLAKETLGLKKSTPRDHVLTELERIRKVYEDHLKAAHTHH